MKLQGHSTSTKSVQKAPARSQHPELAAGARAQRVLAEYLRQWGLRDPAVIAAHCRRWVQQAAERIAAGSERAAALDRLAIELAIAEIDGWLDHLSKLASTHAGDAHARRGLLAVEMQMLADRYSGVLLSRDGLPSSLMQHLRHAARPIVPPVHRVPMRPQPMGELPWLLSPQRWWQSLRGLTRTLLEPRAWFERGRA